MPGSQLTFSSISTLAPWAGPWLVCGYLLVWMALILHCLRRDRFYPVFGNHRGSKCFWLATFGFFHPGLTLLYLVFGVFASRRAKQAWWRTAMVAVPCLWMIVVTAMPVDFVAEEPVTLVRDGDTGLMRRDGPSPLLALQPAARYIESANVVKSIADFGPVISMRPAHRHIAIVLEERHPLLDQVAASLQRELAAMEGVHRIDVYPAGTWDDASQNSPDLLLQLRASQLSALRLPGYARLKAEVAAVGGNGFTPEHLGYRIDRDRPLSEFLWGIKVEHSSTTWGLETASERYELAGRDIARRLCESLSQALARPVRPRADSPGTRVAGMTPRHSGAA